MIESKAILKEKIQIDSSAGKVDTAVPLRLVIKEVIIHLYCQGVLPKTVTQKLFDSFQLKSH